MPAKWPGKADGVRGPNLAHSCVMVRRDRPAILRERMRDPAVPSLEGRVLEHLSTAVLLFDREDRLVTLNPAAENMLELSARQACGATAAGVLPPPNPCLALIERAVLNGQALTERDLTLGLATRVMHVDCTVTPVPDLGPAGPPGGGFLVELVDVERHRRISREEQLLAQNETARRVLRGLAHEIRNPLGGLRGAAQLLEREVDGAELAEYCKVIIAEADRLQALLDRMFGPRRGPARRRLSIHEVTERVCALLDAESPPEVEVARDYDPSIPDLEGDYDLLVQALLNIGRNAVQALVPGEGPSPGGRVTFQTRIERNLHLGARLVRLLARVDVIDDGPGVPQALRESLFYPLVTGRPDGSGLGLSIAQSLVQQHGGLIECTSRPGETRFSVLLPVEP